MPPEAGVSLIEVVVALMILSVVLLAAYVVAVWAMAGKPG